MSNHETDSETMTHLRDSASSFEAEMIVKRDKTEMEFYMECVAGEMDKEKIQEEYSTYVLQQQAEDEDPDDILDKEEWLDEVYFVENGDDITDLIYQHHEALDIEVYKNASTDEKIINVCLGLGGPNIYITLDTKRNKALWEGGWGGETHELNLSYLYDTIIAIYDIEY